MPPKPSAPRSLSPNVLLPAKHPHWDLPKAPPRISALSPAPAFRISRLPVAGSGGSSQTQTFHSPFPPHPVTSPPVTLGPGPASPLPLLPTQSLHPSHGRLPPAPRLPPPSPSSLWVTSASPFHRPNTPTAPGFQKTLLTRSPGPPNAPAVHLSAVSSLAMCCGNRLHFPSFTPSDQHTCYVICLGTSFLHCFVSTCDLFLRA